MKKYQGLSKWSWGKKYFGRRMFEIPLDYLDWAGHTYEPNSKQFNMIVKELERRASGEPDPVIEKSPQEYCQHHHQHAYSWNWMNGDVPALVCLECKPTKRKQSNKFIKWASINGLASGWNNNQHIGTPLHNHAYYKEYYEQKMLAEVAVEEYYKEQQRSHFAETSEKAKEY